MPLSRRVLFITESFGVGGTERHLLDLLPLLRHEAFEVGAFCFSTAGSHANELNAAGIPVYVTPFSRGISKRSPLSLLRFGISAGKLYSVLRHFRPTIVHFFLPGPYLLGAPIAMAAGVPIKVMSRRSLADYRRYWPGTGQLERLLHRHMDAILGNSRPVVKELMAEGCSETQVHLIYNGVRIPNQDLSRGEARAKLGIADSSFIAIVVANLLPYKGHVELIASLAKIADQMPKPWTLLCAGRDEGAIDITRAIARAGLSTNVQLLGERSDVSLLLCAADISILAPTRNESFSNAVLESMAAGLPMVVTNVGGNAEAVIDGQTGFVVPKLDPAALGAAILSLAHDAELRQSMGDRARSRVARCFSLSACVEQYCRLYEELLESNLLS